VIRKDCVSASVDIIPPIGRARDRPSPSYLEG
jgi:hypothetical protein